MRKTQRRMGLVLADNLLRLMAQQGLSQAELARRSGVSQPSISAMLRTHRPLEINPVLSTVARIAAYFNVQPWQLMIPGFPVELATSKAIGDLVERYRDSGPDGRAAIERALECELRYAAAVRVMQSYKEKGTP